MDDREMSTTQVGNALIRASEVDSNCNSSFSKKAAKVGAKYTNTTFPPYVKAAARQVGAHTKHDFEMIYEVYKTKFGFMNFRLFATLLTEIAKNPDMVHKLRSIQKLFRQNHRRRKRGGIVFTLGALIAGITAAATTAGTAVAATAATVGTAIASSSVATAAVAGAASAASGLAVEAIVKSAH